MRAGDRVGEVEIVRRAGAGGCGVVYEGRDVQGRPVAIKVLLADSPKARARFAREVSFLAGLKHDHIAGYISHGVTEDGLPYLVEEWADGESLAAQLTTGLSMRDAVAMAKQIASALAAAHAQGIVHRDVKPQNIAKAGGRWILLDFGVAKADDDSHRLTRTGAMIGTVGYMAPEQARAEKEISSAADIFSLGAVLYEALTGQPAFAGLNKLSIRAKILLDNPLPLARYCDDAPPLLVALLASMLAKSPEARPVDGAATLHELSLLGVLPETMPKPIEAIESPTVELVSESPNRELTGMVLSSGLVHLASEDLDSWRERLRVAVSSFPGRPWILEDGALVFASKASATESGPEIAARAALAAKQAFPDLAIAVVSTSRSDSIGKTIEHAASALEAETVGNIFAEFTTPAETEETCSAISIDETTAANLSEDFSISRAGGKITLLGLRARQRQEAGGND